MALTSSHCYSKLEDIEAHLNSDMNFFGQPQPQRTNLTEMAATTTDYYINGDDDDQLMTEFLGFDSNLFSSDKFVDNLFWDSHCPDYNSNFQCNNYLPSTSSSSSSPPPEIFPAVNYEYDDPNYHLQQQMKRQKFNFNYPDIDFVVPKNTSSFFDEKYSSFFDVSPFLDHHFAYNHTLPLPLPPTHVLPYYYSTATTTTTQDPLMDYYSPKKPAATTVSSNNGGGGGNLSSQSIAARQRRRKITEKTQELGKLIPGGHRMNTADMFQAAFKYIKFLQAQVGILQTDQKLQEYNGGDLTDKHQVIAGLLLGSSLIQEKLYSAEKCLVPKNLADNAETLQNHHHQNLKLDSEII